MPDNWRVVVVTADPAARRNIAQALSRFEIDPLWISTVDECGKIQSRNTIDLVFCDEQVQDGDYWHIYGAISRGLIKRPKIVLISRSISREECEQAERCGMFAIVEAPCLPASVEWTVILAKRAARNAAPASTSVRLPKFDIFAGAPDRDAVWLCAVEGLANAKEHMERIAAEKPGRYFIFYAPERTILSQTETFARPQGRPDLQRESA